MMSIFAVDNAVYRERPAAAAAAASSPSPARVPIPVVLAPLSIATERVLDMGPLALRCHACHCLPYKAVGWPECSHLVCSACFARMEPKICPLCRRHDSVGARQSTMDHLVARLQVRCEQSECPAIYHLRDTDWSGERQHDAVCLFKDLTCGGCRQTVVRRDMPDHTANQCESRTTSCPHCDMSVSARLMGAHLTADGCVGLQDCPNGCCSTDVDNCMGSSKRRRVGGDQAAAAASSVPVSVVNKIRQPDLAAHLAAECPRRVALCAMCPNHVIARHMDRHLADPRMIAAHFHSLQRKISLLESSVASAAPVTVQPQTAYGSSVVSGTFYFASESFDDGVYAASRTFAEISNEWNTFKVDILAVYCTWNRNRNGVRSARAQPGKLQLTLTCVPLADTEVGVRPTPEQYRARVSLLQIHQLGDPLDSMDRHSGFNRARRAFTTKVDFTSTRTNDVIRIGEIPKDMFDDQNALLVDPHHQFAIHVELFRRT